ncbi:MAG TPA: DNA polymerase Y family protein [Sphingomicrobium sp.]|nr:DNA polymerase Y family protein [Sphingomicrobium sp.]
MRRVLSIWFPALAIERWAKGSDSPPDQPVVLTIEGTHGPIIHAVTKAADERGAKAGARLTDARALDPALVAVAADPQGDEALLQRLAKWAQRWSPLVEVDGSDALRLDVTGVAHLFGGEAALADDVRARFVAMGVTVRVAIAPTAAAAWALSRFGGEDLTPLHVSALRLDPDTVRTLERLGLKTIGAVAALPRLALARRFRGAEDVVDALDRLLGRKPEPLTALADDPPPRASLRLEEPVTHSEAAPQALERLIPKLVVELEERRLGARKLSLHGFRVDGSVASASVSTAIPSREPKHLQRLLAGVIADGAAALDPGFGFDAFAMVADWTESLDAAQESLVEEPSGERDLARLVDRLTVKLGPRAVRRPERHESHLPERASGWVAAVETALPLAGGAGGGSVHSQQALPPTPSREREGEKRPQRLLDRPEAIAVIYATPEGVPRRFVWRRSVHDIARVEGPERIAPEWWRERSTARLRDYYRVEDEAGRRYWIFREGLIGDGRGGVPEWYLHGLFG